MQRIINFFKRNKTHTAPREISEGAISNVYNNRYKEIESLRQYDRGEKTITASNLKNIVRSV